MKADGEEKIQKQESKRSKGETVAADNLANQALFHAKSRCAFFFAYF